ncbi:MAG TPA: ABC transporter substrate-binding protein [Candidatus Dormibacteraeota bacterium]|nr:ABC transporter substrate-binding protein [Candidatus Dormibacteraeota bacterium]
MSNHPTVEERIGHGVLRTALVAAAVVVALSSFYVAPKLAERIEGTRTTAVAADGQPGSLASANPSGDAAGKTGVSKAGGGGGGGAGNATPRSGLSCTGDNGGKTDVGVDSKSVNLAGTEVESGIGASFLGPVHYGIQAVLQKVNREGGVCQRQVHLVLKDDGWDTQRGRNFLRNFIDSNQYFALAVVPSSNGLDSAATGHDIENAQDPVRGGTGIPVIGTDGMLNSQYSNPWIWPVAASTATSMRIMAHDAVVRAKKQYGGGYTPHLGIVYDQTYPFGPEGAGAFVNEARREGATVDQPQCTVALQAGQNGYGTQAKGFNDSCGEQSGHPVDFVALLLEPQTAETWLRETPFLGTTASGKGLGFGGPQPLFDKNFADHCGATCNNMEVWTSFFPPINPYDQQKDVRTFKADLCAVDNNCEVDALSAFTESGYVGMELVVESLTRTSPDLTRDRLRATLDSTSGWNNGLTGPLTWKKGNHLANTSMVAFRDTYSGGAASFQNLFDSQYTDPCASCHDAALGS